MGTKRRVAIWFRRGKEFLVEVPGMEGRADFVFASQDQMVEWAHGTGFVLKEKRYGRRYA